MTNSKWSTGGSIEIRAVRAGDHLPAELPIPQPDQDRPRWRRSRIALKPGQIVGVASIALAPATESYFCEINVLPAHRRQGIGTQLYAAIHELTDPRYPVLARAMSSQPLRRAFAESLGCSVRTHCPEPWIDPTTEVARRWIADQRLPSGYTTVAMADHPEDEIVDAWTTYYLWAHERFGTVRADHVRQTWDGFVAGLDSTASMITVDENDTIVAFSLVSPDAWEGRTMIVSETVQADQRDGSQLLRATVAASLSVLAERGVHRVELEGHTTDPHSPSLVETLPSDGGDPMDILELKPPAA